MVDYHIHPDFSHDAQGSVDEFCTRAAEIGLGEICFTTHYEPDPARSSIEHVRVNGVAQPVNSDWPDSYLAAIRGARTKFADLVVLAGVEVGYEPGLEGVIGDFLSRFQFDFVLGSVHCLEHVAITAGDELDRFKREQLSLGPEHFAESYFRNVRAAAGTQLFDCLGHLDIYRKYIRPLFDSRFDQAVDTRLPSVLKFVAESGTGMEVNTSALRRGNAEPYPELRILKLARNAGVRVFTTGSDAHRPADLGMGLDMALRSLNDLGVEPARFRQRRVISPAQRRPRAASRLGFRSA
ncbi:MAG TPA: histidinol-phosphatase [bacterium]|nr:histidinol-phosphatase [bacterium]